VSSNWGVVLVEQNKIETPAVATGLTKTPSGANNILTWNPVVADTTSGRELAVTYEIYRGATSTFTPSAGNLVATITPPNFGGTSTGKVTYTHVNAPAGSFYKIRAINAGGKFSTTAGF
jgi:hypothetical protein